MQKEISLYRTTLFGVKLESKQLRKKERRKAYDFLYLLYPYLGPRNSSRTPRNRVCLPRSPKNVNLPFLDSSIPRGVKFSEELPFLILSMQIVLMPYKNKKGQNICWNSQILRIEQIYIINYILRQMFVR